jgi:hypothetical protein
MGRTPRDGESHANVGRPTTDIDIDGGRERRALGKRLIPVIRGIAQCFSCRASFSRCFPLPDQNHHRAPARAWPQPSYHSRFIFGKLVALGLDFLMECSTKRVEFTAD